MRYFDTYSSVLRISSIQTLIVIVAINKLEIYQMDVKITFLNGDLDEKVYMEESERFVINGQQKKVYQFVKSLYILRQTPKQWHTKFDKVMLPNQFKINEVDKYIYVKNTNKYYIIICLYMDDMLILGSNGHMIKIIK